MSGSLLIWAILAIATFWSVGVYNRLMRMRARGVSALGSVEKYMKQYGELASAHVSAFGQASHVADADVDPGTPLPVEWTQLFSSLATLDAALKEVHAAPLAKQPLAHVGEAFEGLQQTWALLLELPGDSPGSLVPETLRLQWEATTLKAQTARGGFNQIMNKYNEAIEQFPARLAAGVMRFEPAGQL